MIDICLYTFPAPASGSGKREFQLEARTGMTVGEAVKDAAIGTGDYYVVMINGYGAELGSRLDDGDQVVLFPAISGG